MATEVYGIDAVSRITGVSKQVLRAWERRYDLVTPRRTSSGRRQYSQADVDRIRKCVEAVSLGHKIGDVARLPADEIDRLLLQLQTPTSEDNLLEALQLLDRFDDREFVGLLEHQAITLAPFEFCLWCSRFLSMLGEKWKTGSLTVAAEHWATAHIKSVLHYLLRFGRDRPSRFRVMFTTLPGEQHELGTLMAAVCAKDVGADVTYFGPNLPVAEIVIAALAARADAVALGAVTVKRSDASDHVRHLRSELQGEIEIWIGGRATSEMKPYRGVRTIGDFAELRHQIIQRLVHS